MEGTHVAAPPDVPSPEAPEAECSALVLQFQRVLAQLVRAGLVTRTTASRLTRTVSQASARAEKERGRLPHLLFAIQAAIAEGILVEGVHYAVPEEHRLALHLEKVIPELQRLGRISQDRREVRHLVRQGRQLWPEVILSCSARVRFRPGDRRRALVLAVPQLSELLGRRPAVPVR
jgi:hypothetical protein